VWVYLFAVFVLGESGDRRGWQSVLLAAAGAVVIVAGGWPSDLPPEKQREEIAVLLMGLGSGIVYAGVVLFLRVLRGHSAVWLVALNLLGSAAVLGLYALATGGPSGFVKWVSAPSAEQFAVLALGGILQMGVPYWLFTRGLKSVSPHEAAIITLIEPLLNPVWAYFLTPSTDTPTASMFVGGALILLALAWRYLPWFARGSEVAASTTPTDSRHREEEMA
jgi:drug/metabolite transporter (DMT)-like permease